MNPNKQCRLCNCSFKVKFCNSSISTENLFNPSKRKGCKGEILAQNLQRGGFEIVKCDKHSSRVCNRCARKIRNLGSLYSFIQESLQGKITEFTAATPAKSTSANKRAYWTLQSERVRSANRFECYRRRPKQTRESIHGNLTKTFTESCGRFLRPKTIELSLNKM